MMSLLTVPADYLDSARMSPVGLVLAHGGDADDWRAPLLEQLAARFAAAGHVVMRYFCPLKEQRRHRILEKAFEVARTSPYAAAVSKWVFVGYDNGARIAAGGACCPPMRLLPDRWNQGRQLATAAWTCCHWQPCMCSTPCTKAAQECNKAAGTVAQASNPHHPTCPLFCCAAVGGKVASRATVSGFAFLSYPLLDPAPPPPKQKAGAVPPADSGAHHLIAACRSPDCVTPLAASCPCRCPCPCLLPSPVSLTPCAAPHLPAIALQWRP